MGPKKQAGAELKKKKENFWSKIGKIFQNNVQKLSDFKENKGLFGPKKTSWVELKNKKKRIFWLKVGPKIEYKGQKLTNLKKKKKKGHFGPKQTSWD